MTANRRIALNVVATYGRSLYAMVLGLFTARWALQVLGQVDYGLYGVVGGLTAFVAILNSLLATGVARFYAISVGKMSQDRDVGLRECHHWFTTAVVVHSCLASGLVLVGYPLGVWVVEHYLTIPADRIVLCVWVWRFALLSCFVSMASVPFQAMYTAKQEIAELTIYAFVTSTLNALFLYYMVTHPGVWLAKYAAWLCLMGVVPQLLIATRAWRLYDECRFVRSAVSGCLGRIRDLLGYSGWLTFGFLGGLVRSQGMAILVNKAFGPALNASMTIGHTLSIHCDSLSGSLVGAFSPAIMNAYGAGDFEGMRKLAYRACKLATIFLLMFAIPLMLEVDEVLVLWLKEPPAFAGSLCIAFLVSAIVDKTAIGHMIAVNAHGKIALYQAVLGTSLIAALPLAVGFVSLGLGIRSVGLALVLSMMLCAWGRVWFARRLVGMSAVYWLMRILAPLATAAALSIVAGLVPRLLWGLSFGRVCATVLFVEGALLPLCWFWVMDEAERQFAKSRIPILRRRQK